MKSISTVCAVMLICTSIFAHAKEVETKEQKIDRLTSELKTLKDSQDGGSVISKSTFAETISAVEQISVVGAGAITATARGIGAAASDFAKTPAGMVVTAGAIYHFVGDSVVRNFIRIAVKPFLYMFTLGFSWFVFKRLIIDRVEYEFTPARTILFGAWTLQPKRQIKSISYISAHEYNTQHFLLALMSLVCLIGITLL